MSPLPKVTGISLITTTDEEVDQAAALLRAIGLEVVGEDGYVEVRGPDLTLSIMRGAMVEVARQGGVLLQIRVTDVAAAAAAAERAGGTVELGPDGDSRTSAFVGSPVGFTVELQADIPA